MNMTTLKGLISMLVLGASAAMAQAGAGTRVYDIPAQSTEKALTEFGVTTGLQVLFATKIAAQRTSPAVKGELTDREALERLLDKSGLKYEFINERTVRITSAAASRADSSTYSLSLARNGTAAEASASTAQLAQAAPEGTANERGDQEPEKAPVAPIRGVPEILVKGARSANTDIERTKDDVQPYVVFTADDVERSMAGDLQQFLKTRLPMISATYRSTAQTPGNIYGTTSSIQMRGLGTDETLILVNGRKMAGVSTGSSIVQPDLNGIPMSSVERIEVLPATAGGIYGGGATGGVINIILKREYSGVEAALSYDNNFDMEYSQRRIDLQGGFTLEGGRTEVMITAGYRDSGRLTVGEAGLLPRARQLQLQNNPAAIFSPTSPPLGATTNIRSVDGSNLTLKSGAALNSPITHVPYGYAGPSTDNGAALVAGAGEYNLDFPGGLGGLESSALAAPVVSSGALSLRREFSERVEAFIDASYRRNASSARRSSFTTSAFTLPATAATNPFQQNIRVVFPGTDFVPPAFNRTKTTSTDLTGGMLVRLPRDWTAQAEYSWGRSNRDYRTASGNLSSDGLAARADGRLDVLRDTLAHPLDYSSYYAEPYYSGGSLASAPVEATVKTGTLRTAGPLYSLPGGPLMLSALLERHKLDMGSQILVSGTTNFLSPPRGQQIDSIYGELTAPLISRTNARPLLRALEVQLSYRHDENQVRTPNPTLVAVVSPNAPLPTSISYVTNKTQADQYMLGLRYQPFEALALRVSHAKGVLPPSVDQIVPSVIFHPTGFPDAKRGGNRSGPTELILGGNPDLVPEQSRSWSAGAIFTPTLLPGLRLSLDYTRIEKTDEISGLISYISLMLEREDLFPGRVTRADLTADEIALGYTGGQVLRLDVSNFNLARTEVEAWDVQADYAWDTAYGTFSANLIATYTTKSESQVLPILPVLDAVGYGESGGPLAWRGNAGIVWERRGWSASWNMQYYNAYYVYPLSASPTVVATAILNQGSATVPRQVYHDLFVKYRFDEPTGGFARQLLADSQLTFGVSNVLDKLPPILAAGSPNDSLGGGGYSAVADPRGRSFSVSWRKSF